MNKVKTILFLDDDLVRFEIFLANIKHDDHFKVFWATSVHEAKKILMCHDTCLMMLDNDLGDGVDGVELAKWIVSHEINKGSQYIVHSMNPIGSKRIFNHLISHGYDVYSLAGAWSRMAANGNGEITYIA